MCEFNKPVSKWVTYCTNLINKKSKILDVACGSGRHTKYLIQKGHNVTAVDINPKFELKIDYQKKNKIIKYDLENEVWPFETDSFDCILVTDYLHRPLFPFFIESVKQNGFIIYETFSLGNEKFGKPSNPDYLLDNNELLNLLRDKLRIISYQDGIVLNNVQKYVQRVFAIKSFDRINLIVNL
jgi:SAM-dependent methyltransferase